MEAIVAVVDAYDAAHRYKDFSIRQNLIKHLLESELWAADLKAGPQSSGNGIHSAAAHSRC